MLLHCYTCFNSAFRIHFVSIAFTILPSFLSKFHVSHQGWYKRSIVNRSSCLFWYFFICDYRIQPLSNYINIGLCLIPKQRCTYISNKQSKCRLETLNTWNWFFKYLKMLIKNQIRRNETNDTSNMYKWNLKYAEKTQKCGNDISNK